VLSSTGLCAGLIVVHWSRNKCGVFKCDREAPEGKAMPRNQVETPEEISVLWYGDTAFFTVVNVPTLVLFISF
jgi:hypothetical protein